MQQCIFTATTAQRQSLHRATWVHILIYLTVLRNNGQCIWAMRAEWQLNLEILWLLMSPEIQKKLGTWGKDSLFASHANRQTRVVDGCRDEDHTGFRGGNQTLFLLILADSRTGVCDPPMSFFTLESCSEHSDPRESPKPWVRCNGNGGN